MYGHLCGHGLAWEGRGGERWGSRPVCSSVKHTGGMVRKVMVIRPGLGLIFKDTLLDLGLGLSLLIFKMGVLG